MTVTLAVAPVPPPPDIVKTGGDAASYPVPALVIPTLVTAPNVFFEVDLYDQIDTPFTQVPIGPGFIVFLVDIVVETIGKRFNLRWLPGKRAEPGNGPIL